jgi:hypothetical protein
MKGKRMGRKKVADPKDIRIRITRAVRRQLAMRKTNYHMPAKYKEGDVIEAVLKILTKYELQQEKTNVL